MFRPDIRFKQPFDGKSRLNSRSMGCFEPHQSCGATRADFAEWLCLQNTGSADTHTTITDYTSSGQAINKPWTVSADSRLTVNVNQDAGPNQDISARVSSDNPMIVERPMYFDYNGWTGGHDVVGYVPQ